MLTGKVYLGNFYLSCQLESLKISTFKANVHKFMLTQLLSYGFIFWENRELTTKKTYEYMFGVIVEADPKPKPNLNSGNLDFYFLKNNWLIIFFKNKLHC